MAVQPTNCFICKTTWLGTGPVCDKCLYVAAAVRPPQAAPANYKAKYVQQPLPQHPPKAPYTQQAPNMARKRSSRNPFTQSYFKQPPQAPLKQCSSCKGNYLIESAAGSVCSSCKTVVHNPCRNCESTATKGIKSPSDNHTYVECSDCLFIE